MKKAVASSILALVVLNVEAQNDSIPNWKISGYAEIYYTYDFNHPENNQLPGYLYSYNRHNEFNLNLGMLQIRYNDERIRGNLALMTGTYVKSNLAAEPEVLKNIYEANIGIKLSRTYNLWIDTGIMPSHIGFESAVGANVATLTRSIQAENSPYFSAGVKLSYVTPAEKWFFSVHMLNGWQRIQRQEGNTTPAFGHQITYTPNKRMTFNSSSFIGSDTADTIRTMRYFHNFYIMYNPVDKLSFIAGLDVGAQQKEKHAKSYDLWYSPVIVGTYRFHPQWSGTARVEYYDDKHGVIIAANSPKGFQTWGFSLNVDHQFTKSAVWRTEVRKFNGRVQQSQNSSNETFITTSLALKF